MKTHQIYFLQRADGLIKIGTSGAFQARLAQLTSEHGMLGIVRVINGDVRRERQIHRKFKRFHEYGEWFRPEKGSLIRLIDALDEGAQVTSDKTDDKAAWKSGEADLTCRVRDKLTAAIEVRMDRSQLKRAAAIVAVCDDYGLPKWFAKHLLSGNATSVSAYGAECISAAYRAELAAALAFFQGEVARLHAEECDDDEIFALGDRVDDLVSIFAARKVALK
jgi:hypothetical protein